MLAPYSASDSEQLARSERRSRGLQAFRGVVLMPIGFVGEKDSWLAPENPRSKRLSASKPCESCPPGTTESPDDGFSESAARPEGRSVGSCAFAGVKLVRTDRQARSTHVPGAPRGLDGFRSFTESTPLQARLTVSKRSRINDAILPLVPQESLLVSVCGSDFVGWR